MLSKKKHHNSSPIPFVFKTMHLMVESLCTTKINLTSFPS